MVTDIFKLIFHHDQRLSKLDDQDSPVNPKKMESSLEDFMKPDPTFSSFFFSGTDLDEERFGLNVLNAFDEVINALQMAFPNIQIVTQTNKYLSIKDAVEAIDLNEALVLSNEDKIDLDISDLNTKSNSHKKTLKKALETGHMTLYKVPARNGFDLLMYSQKNVYREMFFPLQKLVPDHFRFFSINGKKFNTERHFFFETWTLDRPPHGFEEVHPETVL